jgi:S1-C subfamily serine protease
MSVLLVSALAFISCARKESDDPAAAPVPTREVAGSPPAAATSTVTRLTGPGDSAGDLFAPARASLVTVVVLKKDGEKLVTGSGFFVDSSGRVVTTYGVIKDSQDLAVISNGNRSVIDARVLSQDPKRDVALLQAYVNPPVRWIPLGSSQGVKMGDTVFALGCPSGPALVGTLTKGIISTEKAREIEGRPLLQHDAALNPGSGGGPLLNVRGEIIAVNTQGIKGMPGLNFAIPAEEVLAFLKESQ